MANTELMPCIMLLLSHILYYDIAITQKQLFYLLIYLFGTFIIIGRTYN